ncbi:AMP-activated serine/threonine-protein kinase regulatory subunit [Quaeritorhiza haematococci]|nr:AMP-activated serine/threonine-protein kinase regulatory subunit [Quaeritorhiza haematococci]
MRFKFMDGSGGTTSDSDNSNSINNNHEFQKQKDAFIAALRRYTCYEILPISYKLIVFDTTLLVKKALAALLQHVTDFINLILFYYNHTSYDAAIEEIEQLQIYRLRASKILLSNHLHRLPLIDRAGETEMIISVVTQYKILKFVAANPSSCCVVFRDLIDTKISNADEVTSLAIEYTVPGSQPNAVHTSRAGHRNVLNTFISLRISAIPLVDEHGNVLDVCEKYDILTLAREGAYYDLEMPVSEALHRRSPDFEGIHTCTVSDTLGSILDTIRRCVVHRTVTAIRFFIFIDRTTNTTRIFVTSVITKYRLLNKHKVVVIDIIVALHV